MTSNYMPDVSVEIAFDSGYSTPVGSRTWTDVSDYVELAEGISIGYGRADEFAVTDANSLSLTLDNSDGRFTAGRAASPYYPNVRIGRPIRVTATPVGGTPSVRFVGYVDEWPVAWDGTDNYAKAQITARSRLARLGFDAQLASIIEAEYLASAPALYFPLQEPEGSTAAHPTSGSQNPLMFTGSGTVPVFGAAGVVEGQTSATITNPGMSLGSTLSTSITSDPSNDVLIECFRNNVSNATVALTSPSGDLSIDIGGGDSVQASFDGDSTGFFALGINWNHVAALLTDNGIDKSIEVYGDGVLLGTTVGGPTGTVTFTGIALSGETSLAHVAVNADFATIANRSDAGETQFGGDTASDWIERLASYVGVPAAEITTDAGTNIIEPIDTTGATALDAMRKVEATEGGVLLDARDNTLTFHGRARRYNTTPAFTLDVAAHEVETDVAPKLDRSTLTNDVTATASDGTTARATNQDSIDDYGYARQSLEIASTNDAAYQAAAWRVALYAEPAPRIPSLGVNLLPLSQTRQDDLFELDISSVIEVENFPTQAAATSAEFFIEGYAENIGQESYMFTFNVSPTTGHDVWTIEDPVFGQYDAYPIAQ